MLPAHGFIVLSAKLGQKLEELQPTLARLTRMMMCRMFMWGWLGNYKIASLSGNKKPDHYNRPDFVEI